MRLAVTPSLHPSEPIMSYIVIVVSSAAPRTDASHLPTASDGASHFTPSMVRALILGRFRRLIFFPFRAAASRVRRVVIDAAIAIRSRVLVLQRADVVRRIDAPLQALDVSLP